MRQDSESRWTRDSVADGEAGALLGGFFKFVDQGDGIVLHRDATVALRVGDELVGAEAKLAGALAGLEECCRTEVCPVDV